MLHGIITAIITPFREGNIDWSALEKIINYQSDAGIHALVVAGSTGEGLLLTEEQKISVIQNSLKFAKGRLKIIASTGSPSTQDAVTLSQKAQDLGVDGILVISPWYVKPNQESLYQHFKTIHDATSVPMIVYNHPGRCIVDISYSTAARLSELAHLSGFKDSSTDVARLQNIKSIANPKLKFFSGDDPTAPGYLALGGDGIICVGSNVAPREYITLYDAWAQRDLKKFTQMRDLLSPLAIATNLETNPAPIKYAASLLGLCQNEWILPYVDLQESTKTAIRKALELLALKPVSQKVA
ncbi:4-hydroxy-tetrahydrodipicolinate synthase [Candidatus Bealeia paramacronuclearis]|uniref:4-hydroxy-tetrahydrodipicolinate synthase n=1 Tax=Candidatus Bealeia paramacronuclearis TaxID=1921001 RepID=A0ABZ2C7C5_9PROT|nr:4-hydroxy-tetrahydrodipicolinate synthase [Candidatus Bealeia paramacronuclearis]